MVTFTYHKHFPATSVNCVYYPTMLCFLIFFLFVNFFIWIKRKGKKRKKTPHSTSQMCCRQPVSKCQIVHRTSKVLSTCKDLKGTQPDHVEVNPICACSSCFSGCKHPYNFQSLQLMSKATGLGEKALTIFSTVIQKLNKKAVTLDHLFNLNKIFIKSTIISTYLYGPINQRQKSLNQN